MNVVSQRLCIWSGSLFALLFFVGFGVIAGYIPPPLPSNPPEVVAAMYREHANAIRTGMIISMYSLCFWVPFVAAISVQLRRIEGRHTPMTYAQLGLGATLPVAFFPALYYFLVAAFRVERPDATIQMLNDMGWLPFTGIIYAIFVQNVVIGVAVLADMRATPILPRWYGYFSIWCALLYCPASLDVFFPDGGPLSWDGLFSWWLSLVSFFLWLVITTVVLLQAVTAQKRESLAVPASGTTALDDAALAERITALDAEIAALNAKVNRRDRPRGEAPEIHS